MLSPDTKVPTMLFAELSCSFPLAVVCLDNCLLHDELACWLSLCCFWIDWLAVWLDLDQPLLNLALSISHFKVQVNNVLVPSVLSSSVNVRYCYCLWCPSQDLWVLVQAHKCLKLPAWSEDWTLLANVLWSILRLVHTSFCSWMKHHQNVYFEIPSYLNIFFSYSE